MNEALTALLEKIAKFGEANDAKEPEQHHP
jgi:hypothetical protein